MTEEAKRYLAKARRTLANGRTILSINLGDEAGRAAYLAAFHAAQAFIFERTGEVAKPIRAYSSDSINWLSMNRKSITTCDGFWRKLIV